MLRNICWAQRLFTLMIFGLFVLSVSSMLAGCGNKGDLFLPDTSSPNKTSLDKAPIDKTLKDQSLINDSKTNNSSTPNKTKQKS